MSRTYSNPVYPSASRLVASLGKWSGEGLSAENSADDHERMRRQVDRGRMAALRKGLMARDGWAPSAASVVGPYISVSMPKEQARSIFEMAALYTLHPHTRVEPEKPKAWERKYAITSAFRYQIEIDSERDREKFTQDREHWDKKITFLLDATRDEVFTRLRKTIPAMLTDASVPVDWVQLALDLYAWDSTDREVQRRWARGWWGAPAWMNRPDPEADTATSQSSDE